MSMLRHGCRDAIGRQQPRLRAQSEAPVIKAGKSSYQRTRARLVIRGKNFRAGATVALNNATGFINHGGVEFKNSRKYM